MNGKPLNLADLDTFDDDDFATVEAPRSIAGDFVELTKARLNFMVLITTLIGFVVAAPAVIDWSLLLHTLIGTGLCAAAASVLNQAWERDLDKLMHRTADRPVASGRMNRTEAVQLGVLLTVCGTVMLVLTANWQAAALALATVVLYVLVYTPLKRVTTLNTLVGAVPGAVPPLVGYVAAAGHLNLEAAGLFAILFCWQMPHFLAIAILCRDDYAAAGFKMLPVVDKNLVRTSAQMVLWGLLLIVASLIPVYVRQETGLFYTLSAVVLGVAFLVTCVRCAIVRTRPAARVAFFRVDHLPAAGTRCVDDRPVAVMGLTGCRAGTARRVGWWAVPTLLTLAVMAGCGDAPPPPVPRVPAASVAGHGTVTGRVTFDGTAPPRENVRNEPCCPGAPATQLKEDVIVNPNGTLANVFVYLDGGPKTDGSALPPAELDQKFCQYVPHALGVVVGQKLALHSSDDTMHNVRIERPSGSTFNTYMRAANQSDTTTFDRAGFATSKCDVHSWMTAHIGVFDNPFFAVTGSNGTFTITGVPDGTYTLVAWHETYLALPGRPITIKDGKTADATDFSYHPPAP